MAVPVQTPYQEYAANGVTTSFAVTFQCLSKDTLIVTINGVEQSPTLWSFTGGNVVFVAAPANLAIVGIKRSTALNREVTYQAYGNSFRPDVLNNDIDRLWHVLQENQYIYNKKVDKSAQIQTLGNLQGGGQINGGLTLSLKDQTVTANYAFGSSIKIPIIELNQDGTVKSLHDVDLIGGAGGAFQIGWNDVLNKPTTLTGYGITNAYTKEEANDLFIENTEKGTPNGIPALDANGLVLRTQLPAASITQKGITQLVDDLTTGGTDKAATAGTVKLLNNNKLEASLAFGVNQTYQDVTSSRVLGTTYTNTTNKDIWVSVSVSLNAGATLSAIVNGQQVCNGFAQQSSSQAWAGLLVPPNGTYSVSGSGIIKWMERK